MPTHTPSPQRGECAGHIYRFDAAPADAPVPAARVILALHGTGGDENDLLPIIRRIDPHSPVLSPRGNVRESVMLRFFRRFEEGIFDEGDVVSRSGDLAAFVAEATRLLGVEGLPVMAVGYSNGANVAASLAMLHPQVLAGGILLRSMMPLSAPPAHPLAGRYLLLSGQFDTICPPLRVEVLAKHLREHGAEVSLEWMSAGHELTSDDLLVAQEWLNASTTT